MSGLPEESQDLKLQLFGLTAFCPLYYFILWRNVLLVTNHDIVVAACMCIASGTTRARATAEWALAAGRRTQTETWPVARDSPTRTGQCSGRHTPE